MWQSGAASNDSFLAFLLSPLPQDKKGNTSESGISSGNGSFKDLIILWSEIALNLSSSKEIYILFSFETNLERIFNFRN